MFYVHERMNIYEKKYCNFHDGYAVGCEYIFAAPAFADDLQTYNLDTMVVTAQRESKRDVDTPASVTTVSQKQLVETGASNLLMLCVCKVA